MSVVVLRADMGNKVGRGWILSREAIERVYKKEAAKMKKIEVVVIEAGPDYTDKLESLRLELPEDRARAVAEAIKAVEARGYTVLPDDQGGCNEYVRVSRDEEYIAVTVEPENVSSGITCGHGQRGGSGSPG